MIRLATILSLVTLGNAVAKDVDFSRDVLPILSDACYHCHGPDEGHRKAKLRLDTKEGIFRTVDGVTVVAPGDLKKSELVSRITTDDEEDIMPPRKAVRQLKPAEVETLKSWVAQGARWGQHWSFEPMKHIAPPGGATGAAAIDALVSAKLKEAGITNFAPEADRERLLRRVTLDLTGLPPSLAEQDAFLSDSSPGAYEKVVDRLLASPRCAERLATEWLDVARYADTHGYQMDRFRPMWAYRDWVLKAFNENLPFDQFVTWQLAGDLLPGSTEEQQLATAFNRLHCQNEEGGIVEEEYRVAYVVDRVNTFSTAFLGLTTECSRCHDHKYDPLTQRDFYSLFAFFQNIDESGQTTFFTDSTPVPTVLLSTPDQDKKLQALREKIAAAEKASAEAHAGAKTDFAMWADKLPEGPGELAPEGEIARFAFDALEKNDTPNAIDRTKPAKAHEGPKLVPGKSGQAAELDGEDGFTFPGLGHFSRSDAFTFGLWVEPTQLAERAVIFHHSKAPIDAGSRGYELLLENGRVAVGLHHMWPGNSLKVVTKKAVAANAWTHLAVTYDGSSRAAGVHIFVNGEPAELEVVRDGLTKDITYGGGEPELAIGYRFRDSGFKGGRVDDFRIFTRALSPVEVAAVAGRDDYTRAVQAIPGLNPAQRNALLEFYIATAHQPSLEAEKVLHAARDEQRKFVETIPEAMAMRELPQPKKAYILKRGAYDTHGDEVTADTPKVLPPFPAGAPRNRLGLAQWLLDPEHPLMARVTVNRYWQMLLGRGLVETAENFGTQGAQPSDQELLDWLARDFIAGKWDVKRLLKEIVLSQTYRRASTPSVQYSGSSNQSGGGVPSESRTGPLNTDYWKLNTGIDPDDRLLWHAPPRRLTAEMLRDSALADSGLLVEKIGGPSVKPYQPPGLWEEIAMGRPNYGQGKGDDLHRRSIYTFWKRTVPPPSMMTFDAADRSYCTVRRQSTSTPLQALTLLNDVQFAEAARLSAAQAMSQPDLDARLTQLFRTITSRHPKPAELDVLRRLFNEQRTHFAATPPAAKKLLAFGEARADAKLPADELAALTVVAQTLQNHDEAIMRR